MTTSNALYHPALKQAMLEQSLGRTAIWELEPMQPGDVKATATDTTVLETWIGPVRYATG